MLGGGGAAAQRARQRPAKTRRSTTPTITAQQRLAATENFYYVARALSLPETSSLSQLLSAASDFCSRDWSDTLRLAPTDAASLAQRPFLWRYCFGGALAHALLDEVLGLPPDVHLTFANAVRRRKRGKRLEGLAERQQQRERQRREEEEAEEEIGLDWALGAAVLELSGIADAEAAAARAALDAAVEEAPSSSLASSNWLATRRAMAVMLGAAAALALVLVASWCADRDRGGGSAPGRSAYGSKARVLPPLAGMA